MFRSIQRVVKALNLAWPATPAIDDRDIDRAGTISMLSASYGICLVEHDPKGNARPANSAELLTILSTVHDLGPAWYGPFLENPVHLWIDRTPGGGSFGNGWLRIGDPQDDLSVLYRILIHEGTHASNEYRNWVFENEWCMKPGLDWRLEGKTWVHPRQQGGKLQPGDWETLPVDSRDVSTAPGEDLAEMVRYYVHSVKNERTCLWPLDLSKPATFLWATSPTRFVFVRDVFLKLAVSHTWYRQLSPQQEQLAAENLAS